MIDTARKGKCMLLSIAMDWLLAVATPTHHPMPPASDIISAEAPSPPAWPWSTPPFRRYTVADGLPSSIVYRMRQDRDGFLWIGTGAGLVRFDGVSFDVFRHEVSDTTSLPSNRVSEVFIDRNNAVWAAGQDMGLARLDRASGSFVRWRHDEADGDSLASNDVAAIAQASDGLLWIGTNSGLERMRADGKGFDHFRHHVADSDTPASDAVTALLAADDGRLWIGTSEGLDIRMPDGKLCHVPVEGIDGVLAVRAIDGRGTDIRVGTDKGLFVVGADNVARRSGQTVESDVLSSSRDSHGSLWLGTANGVRRIDSDGRGFVVPVGPPVPGSLSNPQVWQIAEDHEHGLWFALDGGGLAYLGPNWGDFSRFARVSGSSDNPSGSRASAMAASRSGRLWIGGRHGSLRLLDPAGGGEEEAIDAGESTVTSLLEDRYARLWVATGQGLFLHKGRRRQQVGENVVPDSIVALAEDPNGMVYAASSAEGIVAIDPHTLEVKSLHVAEPSAGVLETHQMAFEKGVLWQASAAGLSRMDPAHARMGLVPGVSPGRVNAFAWDNAGFWLARPDALEHYDWREGRAVRTVTVDAAAGWPSPDVLGLRVDANGRVWAFGLTGLWRYDPDRRQFRAFGISDGLPSTEFAVGNTVRLADGTVYAMTLGGLIGFRPDSQQDHARAPPLVVTDVRVRRDGVVQSLPPDRQPVRLLWDDREPTVEVRALSYINPRRNRYRFRLEGFDSSWIDTGHRGEREFSGLGAGTYRLAIEAAGRGGLWAETPELTITVAAPPWQRWWAWCAYAMLAATAMYLLLRESQRRLRQRLEVQLAERHRLMAEQANEAKTRFMATLGHEIRTPMTGVLGMAELMQHSPLNDTQRGYVDAMQRSGELLLKLINNALDISRIEAGGLRLELTSFDPMALLEEVVQIQQALASNRGLHLGLEMTSALPARVLGDRMRVQQVLLNLVGNAIKFTEQGHVTVHARYAPDRWQLTVVDSGPGIPVEQQARLFRRFEQASTPQRAAGSGLGLAICRELVALMGGTIGLESEVGVGSRFHVALPLVEAADDTPPVLPGVGEGAGDAPCALRLLLVEDDAIVASVIRGLLHALGHDVHCVGNGLEALTGLNHGRFDALLLDLELPGMDGFQLARMIRRGNHARLPIIAITARSRGDENELTRQAGMDACLRKPVSGEDLSIALGAVGSHA
jgi:signal transduction histidine kinase/streptogramin lyase